MQAKIFALNLRDEPLRCAAQVDANRLYVATRTSLESSYDDGGKSKKSERVLARPPNAFARACVFVPRLMLKKNGEVRYLQLVSGDSDGALRGFRCTDGTLEWQIAPGSHYGEIAGHTRDVSMVARGPKEPNSVSPALLSAGMDGLAFSWNINQHDKIACYDRTDARVESRVPATCIAYADSVHLGTDQSYHAVFVGYADGAIIGFDYSTGNQLIVLREGDRLWSADQAPHPRRPQDLPVWQYSIRGFFWSTIYEALFAAVGNEGVFGYDPACAEPKTPVAHLPMRCCSIFPLGAVSELGVGEEGVAALVATDGRVSFVRPTYSPARREGHFINVLAPFALSEEPPSMVLIMDASSTRERSLFVGYGQEIQSIPMRLVGTYFVHGSNSSVSQSEGASTHMLDLDVEHALRDEVRYLSLIPEPMPNGIRKRLADKERSIGVGTEGADEELQRMLELFATIRAGGEETQEEEQREIPQAFDVDFVVRQLRHISEDGVCPREVLDTSTGRIEETLELLRDIARMFKVSIPVIDPSAAAAMSDAELDALNTAAAALNTAYPTVGMEAETGVSTAESRQVIGRAPVAPPPPQYQPQPQPVPGQQSGLPTHSQMQGPTPTDNSNLPPYLRPQTEYRQPTPGASPYLSGDQLPAYAAPQQQQQVNAYGYDAYAVESFSATQQQQPQQDDRFAQAARAAQSQRVLTPAVYASFDAFSVLARVSAAALAKYIKRARICDSRLNATFGGREARDLAASLGSADQEVANVEKRFERQENAMRERHTEREASLNNMFADFERRFKEGVIGERCHIAASYAVRRRQYANARARAAKRAADKLVDSVLSFLPRYAVISRRWVIVPAPARSFPAFFAYDMLSRDNVMVHPLISRTINERLLYGLSKCPGIIPPLGYGRSADAFNKIYVITPEPPRATLADLMAAMPRALHPHEVAHLIFPLVCTLARIQALPGQGSTVVHRDIRPSTVFLEGDVEAFARSPAPQYDPNAEVYDCGRIPAKRWPKPDTPSTRIFHLTAIRDMVQDEPIEFNTVFCAPEVLLGGVCESTDVWSVGLLVLKLLMPREGGAGSTRQTRVAMPNGMLTPVHGSLCTCELAALGYINDVARLSGAFDKMRTEDFEDFFSVCVTPGWGRSLLIKALPNQDQFAPASAQAQAATFVPHSTFGQYQAQLGALDVLLPGCDQGTLQFLRECLSFKPRQRPSPVKLAHHPWFREHGLLATELAVAGKV